MNIQGAEPVHQLPADNEMSPREIRERKEEIAVSFEEIFARRLVQKMAKDAFSFDDNNSMSGQANDLYRSHIIDTLARKLAEQHTLGISDLLAEMWINTNPGNR